MGFFSFFLLDGQETGRRGTPSMYFNAQKVFVVFITVVVN